MIKFKEVKGLTLENTANLQQIVRTEDGKAIGHIPGWKYFIDPNYYIGTEVRNRALPNSKSVASLSNAITTVDNKKFFNLSNPLRIDAQNNVSVNPTEYTIFAVVDFTGGTSEYPYWVIRGNTSSANDSTLLNVPNFGISPNGLKVCVYNQIRALTYANHSQWLIGEFNVNSVKNSKSSLLILSFNTINGFTLSQDGVVVGNRPYSTPLQNDLNNFSSFRNAGGKAGDLGIFDIDLHKPENTAYRKQLEAHLMKKYAIA